MGRPKRLSILEACLILLGAHSPPKTKARARIIPAMSKQGIRVVWRDRYWVYPGNRFKPQTRIKVWPGEIVMTVRVTIGPTSARIVTETGLAMVPFSVSRFRDDVHIALPTGTELVLPRPRPDREW
jgi:hypothetical protein